MAVVLGIDEAGYGPRLGPLVVAASIWNVNGDPATFDFWGKLEAVVSQQRPAHGADARLQIADSKQVYSPSRGLADLERSVLTILAIAGHRPTSFQELRDTFQGKADSDTGSDPCFSTADMQFSLPISAQRPDIDAAALRLAEELEKQGVQLQSIQADVVGVERFNRLTRFHESKGSTLTQVSLDLVGRCWKPFSRQPMLVLADRHGGRRFYSGALVNALDGRLVSCLCEQADRSHYRVDQTEFRFETRGERHFPVAVASMCAKYLRELTMEAFNRFWRRQIPDLKATKGYPADAKRFRREIAVAQQRLEISDDVLWRIS